MLYFLLFFSFYIFPHIFGKSNIALRKSCFSLKEKYFLLSFGVINLFLKENKTLCETNKEKTNL